MTIGGAKEKYRGMFEIQKSGDKTSSGEIGLDIRTHASPKVVQDQVSGGVSVLCWHMFYGNLAQLGTESHGDGKAHGQHLGHEKWTQIWC